MKEARKNGANLALLAGDDGVDHGGDDDLFKEGPGVDKDAFSDAGAPELNQGTKCRCEALVEADNYEESDWIPSDGMVGEDATGANSTRLRPKVPRIFTPHDTLEDRYYPIPSSQHQPSTGRSDFGMIKNGTMPEGYGGPYEPPTAAAESFTAKTHISKESLATPSGRKRGTHGDSNALQSNQAESGSWGYYACGDGLSGSDGDDLEGAHTS